MTTKTFLRERSEAETLAQLYLDMVKVPEKKVHIELSIVGFDMYPSQKVKLWRSVADAAGGSLNGVLYRIMKTDKNLSNGLVKLECVKD
ncbi:hypothetical protein ES703_111579 [subsurface metagenome]